MIFFLFKCVTQSIYKISLLLRSSLRARINHAPESGGFVLPIYVVLKCLMKKHANKFDLVGFPVWRDEK